MTRRTPLVGWLAAEAASITGTRVSMIAIPWFVLTTTGSATQTGLVAFVEMGPYVTAKALGGPLVDRVGPRRVAVTADAASVLVVGAIPAAHAAGVLSLPLLLVLVGLAGTLRGPGDGAKQALVPLLVDAAGVPMERATGLGSAVERTAGMIGAAVGGVLVAAVGAAQALVVDAASFGVAGALIWLTAPRGRPAAEPADDGSYTTRFREGWDFLRRDRVLVAITSMVAATNLLDQGFAVVFVPVWAHESGGGAATVGMLFAVFAGTSAVGSIIAAAVADRLPRHTTYLVAFLLAGAPRFVVMAMDAPLVAVLVVAVVAGFSSGFINPILGAVIFERIPGHLVGRVSSLNTSLCWSLIPFGGLAGGATIAAVGLGPGLALFGAAYFAATMLPAMLPQWREIDRRPGRTDGASRRVEPEPHPAGVGDGRSVEG